MPSLGKSGTLRIRVLKSVIDDLVFLRREIHVLSWGENEASTLVPNSGALHLLTVVYHDESRAARLFSGSLFELITALRTKRLCVEPRMMPSYVIELYAGFPFSPGC